MQQGVSHRKWVREVELDAGSQALHTQLKITPLYSLLLPSVSLSYSIVIDGERGNRPRIYSLEQLLQEAVSSCSNCSASLPVLSWLSSYTYTCAHTLFPLTLPLTPPRYFHHIILNNPFYQSPTFSRILFHKGLSSETISLMSLTSSNTRSQESPLSAHTFSLNAISISLMNALLLLFL